MEIEKQWEDLRKKYRLPSFKEMDEDFDIGSLEDTNFPARAVITILYFPAASPGNAITFTGVAGMVSPSRCMYSLPENLLISKLSGSMITDQPSGAFDDRLTL